MGKFHQILRAILEARGIKTEEEADIFLNPNYERDLHDPFLMRDMERACKRVLEAIENNEKVMIYTDYDADGIPGAVVLLDLFKKIGFVNYEVYIPQRNSEGYGLNSEAIDGFAEQGINLLITIDLGITAVDEVAYAKKKKIDTIIMDHHLQKETLPKAVAILNPKVDDYPEKMLCAAGVVFKFVQGFLQRNGDKFNVGEGQEKWSLDMVGIATLSDMVPLRGENRALAHFGLKVLRKSRRAGLQKLLSKLRIDQRYITEDDIGFMVTPKLNAASRMDDPRRAFELLETDDEAVADELAKHLLKINDNRKALVATIMREVHKSLHHREMREVIVVGNPKWKVGVLGLVAGKLADEHKKPVFVWGKDENDLIKGSCRSDGSVSVVELMQSRSDHFIEYGGHELAGGFTVISEKIHFLEENLSASYEEIKFSENRKINQNVDYEGDLSLVTLANWREIEKMAPFGMDNPKPLFSFRNLNIESIKKFGKNGEHLEIIFSDEFANVAKAISFFSNEESFTKKITGEDKVDLLATFDFSRFNGSSSLRLRVVDIV